MDEIAGASEVSKQPSKSTFSKEAMVHRNRPSMTERQRTCPQ